MGKHGVILVIDQEEEVFGSFELPPQPDILGGRVGAVVAETIDRLARGGGGGGWGCGVVSSKWVNKRA